MVLQHMFPIVSAMHLEHSHNVYGGTYWSSMPLSILFLDEVLDEVVAVGMLILDQLLEQM